MVDSDRWEAGSLPEATSIVAELTAIYRLLLAAPPQVPLLVLSDSEFAVNVCMKWAKAWKRNGWRKRDGEPVANKALVAALEEVLRTRKAKVEVEWVRGHSGHPLNEAADRLATGVNAAASKAAAPKVTGPGWPHQSDSRQVEPVVEFCGSCDGAINPLTHHCRCGSM